MNTVKVLHNPRCSKSRNAIKILEEKNISYDIVSYLDGVLSKRDIRIILQKLNKTPPEIIRKNEAIYKEKFKDKTYSNDEWLSILERNPRLIERPILYNDEFAVVGRPEEEVFRFIDTLNEE